jgi:hypothetical protein
MEIRYTGWLGLTTQAARTAPHRAKRGWFPITQKTIRRQRANAAFSSFGDQVLQRGQLVGPFLIASDQIARIVARVAVATASRLRLNLSCAPAGTGSWLPLESPPALTRAKIGNLSTKSV